MRSEAPSEKTFAYHQTPQDQGAKPGSTGAAFNDLFSANQPTQKETADEVKKPDDVAPQASEVAEDVAPPESAIPAILVNTPPQPQSGNKAVPGLQPEAVLGTSAETAIQVEPDLSKPVLAESDVRPSDAQTVTTTAQKPISTTQPEPAMRAEKLALPQVTSSDATDAMANLTPPDAAPDIMPSPPPTPANGSVPPLQTSPPPLVQMIATLQGSTDDGMNMGSGEVDFMPDIGMSDRWQTDVARPRDPLQPVPVQLPRATLQQIAEALQRNPDGPTELILNPEELGKVRLTLANTSDGITVSILAERGETLDLLRRHIGQLDQEFRDIGFRDIQFDFGQAGQQMAQDGSDQGGGEYRPAEQDVVPTVINLAPGHAPAAGLDLRL